MPCVFGSEGLPVSENGRKGRGVNFPSVTPRLLESGRQGASGATMGQRSRRARNGIARESDPADTATDPGARRIVSRGWLGESPVRSLLFLLLYLLVTLLAPAGWLGAQDRSEPVLDVAETEAFVRAVYFEGMPLDEARQIGPDGCRRLVEMLRDPVERASHAQIMLAIGICAPPGGFEALSEWADTPRRGRVDRATFRAWQLLPHALGYLAEHDRRAVDRLERLLGTAESPEWTFRHHRGARLVRQARRAAASSLAETGLDEAAAALDRASRRETDPALRAHLREARARHRAAKRERAEARATRAARSAGGAAR